jgi:hypothetical protein
MLEKIGTAGRVAGFDVLLLADAVIVTDADRNRRFAVRNPETATAEPPSRPTDRWFL